MIKKLLFLFAIVYASFSFGQCPQIYGSNGTLTNTPYWINCTGAAYNMNFLSNQSWGAYTINWGDGTPNNSGASYIANTLIPHTYTGLNDTFIVTLNIPGASCTRTGVVVNEKPVNASIQIPIGGVTQACAPKILQFINSSTDVSKTTTFQWNFGDGSPLLNLPWTNAGQTVSHQYNKNTVNCVTQVTLKAQNYCSFGNPTIANFNPIQIFDIDDAAITPDAVTKCFPDRTFTFTNTTNRNCVPQGNTFQRQEWWNLGNHWGLGYDSIVNWRPWPPTTPRVVTYPGIGSYTVMLRDSNLCGIDTVITTVNVVPPPTSGFIAPLGPNCQNVPLTFTNTSSTGYTYKWNFGTGAGFQTLPFGPLVTHTFPNPGTFTVILVALVPGANAACTDTTKIPITILPSPTSSFALSPLIGCNTLSNVTFTNNSIGALTYTWTFGNSNTSNLQTPPAQNYTNTGVFTVSLAITGTNTCRGNSVKTLTVFPKPIPNFNPVATCVGALTQFSNTSTSFTVSPNTGYIWTFGDGSPTSTVTNATHIYTLQNTYTVQLVAKNANCSDSIVKTATVNIKPTANFVVTPTISCPPFITTFSNTTLNGSSYTWNFGVTPVATSTLANPSFTYANTSTASINYTIQLISGTGAGCADTIKKVVQVKPRPTAQYTANLTPGCSPLPQTFTNTSLNASNYIWNFGDGTPTVITTNPSHLYSNTTLTIQTYNAQLIAFNTAGCSDTVVKVVTVYPKPFTTFTMLPGTGCSPLTINFPPVLGLTSYTWDFGDGSPVTNLANPVHTFTNFGTSTQIFTVTLIGGNGFGCKDTSYGNPVIFPKPTSGFNTSTSSGCSPLNVTFTNTSANGSNYIWNFGDGTPTVTTTSPAHTFTNTVLTQATTFTVQLITLNASGCSDTTKKTVTVLPEAIAGITLSVNSGCTPLAVNFTGGNALTTYTWNFGNGAPNANQQNTSLVYTNGTQASQLFTVTLSGTNSFGCRDTVTDLITVFPRPVPNFVATPTIGCPPFNVNFNNTSIGQSNQSWIFGNGQASIGTNASTTYTSTAPSALTVFNVKLVVGNNFACKDSIVKQITMLPRPKAKFNVDTPACSPALMSFTNQSISASTYFWTFGSLPSSTLTSPQKLFVNSSASNLTVPIRLVATNTSGCRDTTDFPLIVFPKPNFFISALPDSGCTPLTVNFPAIVGVKNYLWTFGDGNTSGAAPISNSYVNTTTVPKSYTVQMVGTDINGCKDTTTRTIKVFPKPVALFVADPLIVFVPTTPTNMFNKSTGAVAYSWNFGDNSGTSTETNPSYTYQSPGEYQITLIATNAQGCKDTFNLASKILALNESDIQIPNAFTPNLNGGSGSGIYDPLDKSNDIFHPVVRGAQKYEMSIYSRWGELLFNTRDVNVGWDGYYKGKLCTQDVYVYKITASMLDGKTFNKVGDVLLLK
jgi:gliding motility-associated-like protein